MFTIRLRKILLFDSLYYFLLLITLLYICIFVIIHKVDSNYCLEDTSFELNIKNYKINEDKINIIFDKNMIGTYYFKNDYEKKYFFKNISLNDKLKISGSLFIPGNNTIPNTFNYKRYLEHKNILYIIKINKYEIISKNKNILYKIKNYIYKRINNIKYNDYLYAFILGDSSHIDREVYNNYKINGVTHLFALSGLHVTMFSNILLYIIKKLRFNELNTFIVISIFLIFFSFIASFTPSILRSTIFFILSNINKIYYLFIKQKYLLYLTFIILILINPLYIFNTGFILSFTITFFIILYSENNKTSSILKISILSFLSSLPIIINLSYEVNILGFFNNIFFIPYVTYIVFPLSLITLLFPKLSIILNIFISIMEKISFFSSSILNISIYFSKLNTIEIIIYYSLLIIFLKKKKYLKLLIIFIILIYIKPNFDKNNYVYFIDVGQGDSALIRTKNNKSILIDTGGNYSDYNLMTSNMIPFYKSIGIKKIDYLFLSHGDYDHLGYSYSLVNNFNVENKFINKGNINKNESLITNNILNEDYLKIDNIEIISLNNKPYNNENDNSLVLLVLIDNYKLLFLGDISSKVEDDIIKKHNLNDVDIVKIAHHGSSTSSSSKFINSINPKYSVISVGENNKYGHPNSEVLERLNNSIVYRTDIDGSIIFKIKNNKLKIETCSP